MSRMALSQSWIGASVSDVILALTMHVLQGLEASAPLDDAGGDNEAATFAQAGWFMRANSHGTILPPRDSLKSK